MTGAGSWTDERLARWIGNLLRLGVGIAGAVVLLGGVLYLARHGAETPSYGVFQGEPSQLRSVRGILGSAGRLGGRGIIQLGLPKLDLSLMGFGQGLQQVVQIFFKGGGGKIFVNFSTWIAFI